VRTGSTALEAALVLPAASVAVAVMTWVPLFRAAVVYFHVPWALTVVVPSSVDPSYTLTLVLASPVPARVMLWFALMVSPVITGVVGAVVSICGLPWVMPLSDRLAASPAASLIVAPLRLTAVVFRSGVFCPAATV